MSLLAADGYDHYIDAQITASGQFTSVSEAGTGAVNINAGSGRAGTASFRSTVAFIGGQACAFRTLAPGDTKAIIGNRIKFDVIPSGPFGICSVCDVNVPQVSLRSNADGTLSAVRGPANSTDVLATTTFAISAGATYYPELKTVIHNSTGTVEIKINGVSRASATGLDTQATANTSWNSYAIGHLSTGSGAAYSATPTLDIDDTYVCDGTTHAGPNAFNDFIGDVNVVTVQPTADGNYQGFTPSTGTDHYALVDENPPTDDTDYLESTGVNDRDSFDYDLPASGDILAVIMSPWARKTDSGTRKIVDFVRSGGTDYDGTSEQSLSETYQYWPLIRTADPSTSAAWTAGVKELGIKVST